MNNQEEEIKPVNLTDLNPRSVEFDLKIIDNDGTSHVISLTFRPFVLRDEEYLQRNWNSKEIEAIFKEMKPKEMAMICFRQLNSDSKKKISEIKVMDCDDEGNEFEIPNGYVKLMAITGGLASMMTLNKALIEAKGLSMPLLNKIQESMSIKGKQ